MTPVDPDPVRDEVDRELEQTLIAAGKCGAKKRQGEGRCGQAAGRGTDHPGVGRCKLHGGRSPSHDVAAQRTLAKAAMAKFAQPVDTNAVEALTGLLKKQAGHVEWIEQRILLDHPDGPDLLHLNTGAGRMEQLVTHPLLVVLRDERDALRRISVDCVKLGLREIEVSAMVAAVRREAGEVVALLRAVVDDPELADVRDRVLASVQRQLAGRSSGRRESVG